MMSERCALEHQRLRFELMVTLGCDVGQSRGVGTGWNVCILALFAVRAECVSVRNWCENPGLRGVQSADVCYGLVLVSLDTAHRCGVCD